MSEQQRIFGVLQSMIGGKKKGMRATVEKLYPEEFKNPYVDDGSFEFEKLQAQVIKSIAKQLYGDDSVEAMKAVPEATIRKVLKALKDSYQEEIEFKKQKAGLAMEAASIREEELKKAQKKASYDKYKGETQDKLHQQLLAYKNPQYAKYEKDFGTDAEIKKITESLRKETDPVLRLEQFGKGRKKMAISPAERKRRSDRMKEMHRSGALKK